MKLGRGPSRFWAALYRAKLLRPPMPFWRVVVEAKLNRRARAWARNLDGAVTAVFVWARTIEEAEGLAALALDEEGLDTMTADAVKCPPAARPRRSPAAVARTELGFIARVRDQERSAPPPRPGARA
ncbi:MAG TPA: hypothetical protein VG943_03825 [Caulobacterales bacterium]|nr:hypothetical protein [Caulobacterales bacterium]